MKKIFILLCLFISSTFAMDPVRQKIVDYARKHNGTPYVFGGEDIVNGIDCSAFVQKVMGENGYDLPRTARQQYQHGRRLQIPPERLYPGDLVFFQTYRPGASHVGIASDVDNEFIHASSSRGISSALLSNPWWNPRYLGAKRIIDDNVAAEAAAAAKAKKDAEEVKRAEEAKKIAEAAKAKEAAEKAAAEKAKKSAPKKAVKKVAEVQKDLKDTAEEIAEFQRKAKFLKKENSRVEKIRKWVKKNRKLAGQVCPQLYKYPLKTYLYDTAYRSERGRKKLKFGMELILIGGSKPRTILGDKEIAKACVVLPNNTIDLINSKALSVFPAKGLISPPCKNLKKGEVDLKVRINAAPLEMHFLTYENVYGEMIEPVKIKARFLARNKKIKAIGTVRRGRQAGDYCVEYKGNVYNIYSNNVTQI